MNARGMRWVSPQDKVTVCSHKTNETKTITISEAVRQLLVSKKISLDSKDMEVTVKLNSDGTVQALLLSDNEDVSSTEPEYCHCDADSLPPIGEVDLEGMNNKCGKIEVLNKGTTDEDIEDDDSGEEVVPWWEDDTTKIDTWWRNKSEEKEVDEEVVNWWEDDTSKINTGRKEPEEKKVGEEVDLDLTLEWDDDTANEMQETLFPDVIEDTQLPPERISGILKRQDTLEIKEPDSVVMEIDSDREKMIVSVEEQLDSDDDDDESWKDCWNCKAPLPVVGIYREDPDALRIIFCCEKPCRIKPTNTEIEWGKKSYPYDSWVNHGFS